MKKFFQFLDPSEHSTSISVMHVLRYLFELKVDVPQILQVLPLPNFLNEQE
jgi:hypothetical protein